MDRDAVGFCDEADRFQTDFAYEEKLKRDGKIAREEAILEAKRLQLAEREEARWSQIDNRQINEDEKWNELRQKGEKAKRNNSSVPYNPITLKYNETADGEKLRYADQAIKYRAAIRAQMLQSRMSADGYNPVTGKEMPLMNLPAAPVAPGAGRQ